MEEFLPTVPVLFVCFALAMRRLRHYSTAERRVLWVSFVAHQVAAAANILLYQYYYGYGDMLTYHKEGTLLAGALRVDLAGYAPYLWGLIVQDSHPVPLPFEVQTASSATMQGFASLFDYVLFDSLYAICALVAGLAFFSKLALYDLAREELPEVSVRPLLWGCMLVPSAVVWSAALLKEPFAMIGFFFALRAGQRMLRRGVDAAGLCAALGGCVLVGLVKSYTLPPLLFAFGAWYLVHRLDPRQVRARLYLIILSIGIIGSLAAVAIVGSGLRVSAVAEDVSERFASQQKASASVDANTNFTLGVESGSASGQVALAPLALLTALYRPTLFEVRNVLMVANALENAVFAIGTILAFRRRGFKGTVAEALRLPYLSFCLVFVLLFATLTGLGSTNLGALSRYRAPLVPFFATLLIALLQKPVKASQRLGDREVRVLTAVSPTPALPQSAARSIAG